MVKFNRLFKRKGYGNLNAVRTAAICNNTTKKLYLKAFLYGFLFFLISYIPFFIAAKGVFYLPGDFVYQNNIFWQYICQSFRCGLPVYDLNTDLGNSFIASYSFYGLTSPLVLSGLLFPTKILPYAMPFLMASAYGIASLGACAYCRQYVKKEQSAIICGILYAFSGIQLFNIVFMFCDSVAIFPFLLLSFDKLITERKSLQFALLLALAGFTNYYFLFGECVFIAIYFLVKLTTREYKIDLKLVLKVAFEIILGIGLCMVILLPSFYALTNNARAGKSAFDSNLFVYEHWQVIPKIIQSAIMPPDVCALPSLFYEPWDINVNSVSLYIPVFGLLGVICVIMKNNKSWYSILLYVCGIMMLVPLLNSVFSAFNGTYYARWFYMPLLIMIMLTGKFIDDFDSFKIVKPATVLLIITSAFIGYGIYLYVNDKFSSAYAYPVFYAIFAVTGILIVLAMRYSDSSGFLSEQNILKTVCALCCCLFFVHNVFCTNSENTHKVSNDLNAATNGYEDVDINDDSFFRTTMWSSSVSNGNLLWGYPSITAFNSLLSESTTDFWATLDIHREQTITAYADDYAVNSFLSVKYDLVYNPLIGGTVSVEPENVLYSSSGFNQQNSANRYIVYENENYIPMGYTFDYYINIEQIDEISEDLSKLSESYATNNEDVYQSMYANRNDYECLAKQKLLLKGIWLTDEQIEKYQGVLLPIPESICSDISDEAYTSDCKNRADSSCSYFEPTKTGFESRITLQKDNLVFYSIPYDDSFTAYVNGEKAEVEKVFGGLCAVYAPKGENEIVFEYTQKGLGSGIIISAVSGLGVVIYIIALCLAKRKRDARK